MNVNSIDRLMPKVVQDPDTGCWLWQGKLKENGYGQIGYRGRRQQVHRVFYEAWNGPIPEGLVLDHLCRVRHCVNPRHLEPVTPAENLRRSDIAPATIKAAQTHCIYGHEFTSENTRWWQGKRKCKTCHRDVKRRARERIEVPE